MKWSTFLLKVFFLIRVSYLKDEKRHSITENENERHFHRCFTEDVSVAVATINTKKIKWNKNLTANVIYLLIFTRY